jgi:N-acyl-phosphatidylethanolamine-hydrolysing phospholipase D
MNQTTIPSIILRQLAILLMLLTINSCATSKAQTLFTPAHHTATGFRNLYIDDPNKSIFHFLAMKLFGDIRWADHATRAGEVPIANLNVKSIQSNSDNLRINWLGHSTFLLQWKGVNILTDPIFADRASPLSFAGPLRYIPHVIDYKNLPPIDYVIISHNHYDHLDTTAVHLLGNTPVYLVPLKLKAWFLENGISSDRIKELDWWDTATFTNAAFNALPSQHWSARSLFDRRKTLWASWRINLKGVSIWFAGDTGYNDKQFKEIGDKLGPVDLALIPIGGYSPRSFMRLYHVDPHEALKIHKDVRARQSIAMHWGTFPLTAEGPGDPIIELAKQRKKLNISPGKFMSMAVGETINLKPHLF